MGCRPKPSDRDGLVSKHSGKERTATRLSHAGREPARQHGFVNTPIYRGSTVLFPSMAAIEANDQAYTYGRTGTPTVRALEQAICELEGGHRTLLTPSGLSAIATGTRAKQIYGDRVDLIDDLTYHPAELGWMIDLRPRLRDCFSHLAS